MSFALATLSVTDFDQIHHHLTTHKPPYRTLHLREARQRNKRRVLRHLHALYAPPSGGRRVEGVVSGPGIFLEYELVRTRARTQLNVLTEDGERAELVRIASRFLRDIHGRIAHEQDGSVHYPTRLAGQYYLRRWRPGSPPTHPNCQRAISTGVLDARFVAKLAEWDLQLLCP